MDVCCRSKLKWRVVNKMMLSPIQNIDGTSLSLKFGQRNGSRQAFPCCIEETRFKHFSGITAGIKKRVVGMLINKREMSSSATTRTSILEWGDV